MCGRFLLTTPSNQLSSLFSFAAEGPALAPHFNIAPSQPVASVRAAAGGSGRERAMVRWGLVPAWAKDRVVGGGLINARSETAATRPSFRDAFRRRRCLILADGFYEWKRGARRKRPFVIRLAGGGPFAFAGLWECWPGAGGAPVETAAILTTAANELLRPVHERMPVILPPEHHEAWLDPHLTRADVLRPLLTPFDAGALTLTAVTSWVNDARHDGPRCLAPHQESEPSLF